MEEEDGEEKGEDEEKSGNEILEPAKNEVELVESFFNKFLINSDGSTATDNVNIVFLLRAVPKKVTTTNVHQIDLFRMLDLQNAMVAYENAEMVTSFGFYDRKNKKRV